MGELIKICHVDDVKEGTLKSIDVEGIPLMVTKFNNKYLISARICTHKEYDLTKGHYANGYVTCLLHTSIFDLEDGESQNPPATESLNTYKAILKKGFIYIDL